jgi:hypothetical protein
MVGIDSIFQGSPRNGLSAGRFHLSKSKSQAKHEGAECILLGPLTDVNDQPLRAIRWSKNMLDNGIHLATVLDK